MKRILFVITILVITLYNVDIQAQQRGHGSTGIDIPIKPDDPNGPGGPGTPIPDPIPDPNPDDKVPDEFIGGDVKGGGGLSGIVIPCDCPEDPNYKDVSFELANDLASLITNEQRAKRAWDARQAKWFQRQKEKVVKPAIEKLYGKQYPSFEAAKNALFHNSEKDMFRRHSFEVKRKYNTEKNNLAPKNSTYLKELKALLYRKKEIESGNINNSFYADFKVQGTLIKNIKNLSTINSFRANIFNKFKPNEGRLHFVRDMVKMLYSGMENTSKYKNELYDLKQNLYKQTGDYMNKIDLLQFVYMQEMFKKNMLNNPVNSYQNYDGLYSKYGHSMQSPSSIETYALMNRTGGETVFNPNYWVVLMRQGAISEHEAKAAHDRLMNTKLNQMINAGSIGTNSSVDSVIKELNITDPYQREWLNDNPNKATLFKKLIEEDKKAQSDLEIGNTPGGGLNLGGSGSVFQSLIPDLKDEIKEGALITKKIEEIGITNIDQKRFLYDNNAQRKNIFEFVNNSKISGNIPNEVKVFTNNTVSILANKSISDTEKFRQFENAYDIFEPKLLSTAPQADYEAKIRHYINYFKIRGNTEFSSYLESLLPLGSGYSQDDYIKLYDTIRGQKVSLFWEYVRAIFGVTVKSFEPVIELALWEVGGGLALKILKRLPVRYLTTPIRNVITRLRAPSSSAYASFQHAKKYGIETFATLEAKFIELGLTRTGQNVQFHHLIEVRFKNNPAVTNWLGKVTRQWKSIVLTRQEHQVFTNAWRKRIGYGDINGTSGFNTTTATLDVIKDQARKIYKDYPEILEALGL